MVYKNICIDDSLETRSESIIKVLDYIGQTFPMVIESIDAVKLLQKEYVHDGFSTVSNSNRRKYTVFLSKDCLSCESFLLESLLVHECMHAAKYMYASATYPLLFLLLNMSSEGLMHLANDRIYKKFFAPSELEDIYEKESLGLLTHNDADEVVARAFEFDYVKQNCDVASDIVSRFTESCAGCKLQQYTFFNHFFQKHKVLRMIFKDTCSLLLIVVAVIGILLIANTL